MAVLKGNAYGHGGVEVARAAEQSGAAWLAVARINEALALRIAGVQLPVLVLGTVMPEHVPEAIVQQISLTVPHPDLAREFSAQAAASGGMLSVQAKIDTGMGRLGVWAEEGLGFLRLLKQLPGLRVDGMFTHLSSADEPQKTTTDWQLDRFDRLIAEAGQAGLRPRLVHAGNSAASLYYPRSRYDMIRPGIAIYGLQPDVDAPLPPGFKTALAWKTRLVSIKDLPAGHGVGYNYRYTTTSPERIGVIAVGYADGFRRRLGNIAIIRGRRVPVRSGVCMDQCMISLDDVPDARLGDEVVLIGSQGQACLTAEEVGRSWGTNNYELVCGLSARVPRVYFHEENNPDAASSQ